MTPPDLRAWAEERRARWRIEEGGSRADPWAVEIVGWRGFVYPYGPGEVGVWHRSSRAWVDLLAIGGRLAQKGDTEWCVVVDVGKLEEIAHIVDVRRRRTLSPEQREAAGRRLRAWQYHVREDDLSGADAAAGVGATSRSPRGD